VETPLFETMLAVRDIAEEAEAQVQAQGDDVHEHVAEEVATDVVPPTPTSPSPSSLVLDTCSALVLRVEDDTEVQEAVEVVTTAKLITKVVTAVATQVTAASTPIFAAKPKTLKCCSSCLNKEKKSSCKGILIEDPKPMKKKDQVEMDAEYAKKLQEELDKEHEEAYKQIDWDAALDHVQSKEPQYIKRYHRIKKKPQSESEARKNMISYLKNTKGYKMEFFKGKTYDQILPIF
nr:hypothetical protein [Tanacetum cinerariifolium]